MVGSFKRSAGVSQFLSATDGLDRGLAVYMAESGVKDLRQDALREVISRTNNLAATASAIGDPPTDEEAQQLHDLANSIFSVAGTFELHFLAKTSRALCELLNILSERGMWRRDIVQLHCDAVRAARDEETLHQSAQEEMLLGLEATRASLQKSNEGAR
ncbi:MAG: hypothetical protein R3C25_07730 [Hyphomonadaceae bacterium]